MTLRMHSGQANSLPTNSSLDQLKNQAKDLRNSHKNQNPEACQILRLLHRFENSSDKEIFDSAIKLSECQFALAMNYGFKSWAEMKKNVESKSAEKITEEKWKNVMKVNNIKELADKDAMETFIRILSLSVNENADDLHFEPMENDVKIRRRLDGMLYEMDSLSKKEGQTLIHEIMYFAKMDIARKDLPQDSKFEMSIENRNIDFRISTVPAVHGPALTLRILDKSKMDFSLEAVGFEPEQLELYRRMIHSSHGLILVAGQTGSGKTTTLYSTLKELNKPGRKIVTVEDPVEYLIDGIDQIPVRHGLGLGFEPTIRSILRQAPNIIMAGEIRNLQTAQLLVQASLTGHLVFSTLHTYACPNTLRRLMDIGVEPFLVRDTVRCVMDQRIVRKICPDCKTEHKLTEMEIKTLGLKKGAKKPSMYKGKGCDKCKNTGYKGRIGVLSILEITENVKDAIMTQDLKEIENAAKKSGWQSLREIGLQKALKGVTSIEEILKFT